ncbi:MAG: hypothetical protein ACXW18_07935 [Pyrinomonadaceae bacterium]
MFRLTGLLIICASILNGGPVLSQQPAPEAQPPGVSVLKVKWETFVTTGVATSGLPANAEVNQNRLLMPGQNVSAPVSQTRMYVYSVELSNNGRKTIQALAWDFIFTDATNKTELSRHSLANLQKISVNGKKTLRFTTQASPPRIVSAGGLEKDKNSTFTKTVNIQCLLFTDGSVWEQPKSNEACKNLRGWIERRKKSRSGVEDLPFKN